MTKLLEKGHSVVTTVRSEDKAEKIRNAYKDKADRLEVVIVPDIAKEDAFDEVVKTPGLEVVMHTASPFHFKWTPVLVNESSDYGAYHAKHLPADPKTELIDPAVVGTTGILKALKRSAPGVKRVVVTSSFASIISEGHLSDPNHTFTEKSWNPDGLADITRSPATAYRVSKKLAEESAWKFISDEKPSFDLVTICPPLVFGPVVSHFANLDSINTSNERVVALLQGKWKEEIPSPAPVALWVDARDVAKAHVLAMELPEAGGRRLFTTAGLFSNREVAEIVRNKFPEFKDRLPGPEVQTGGPLPQDKTFKYSNEETQKLLKIEWIPLDKSITDLVTGLKDLGV
ncbi:Ketoreductase azaE [Paramyrothecium foliicola]|nr:Ketoreductase azaE [Paramyrothecium foliicola]